MIPRSTRQVLDGLKKKGFDVYLVGGCVRDLILRRTPKDFDVITSAELKQVLRIFSRCEIVGKRFPICHVHIDGTIIEVSSFSTSARKFGRDLSFDSERPIEFDDKDFVRWRNCLQRDFTVNSLMFDPFGKVIYDYIGGLEDIRKAKVRTTIPANRSFIEDCARILRAIRVAARLGFSFTRDTALNVKSLSTSIQRLDKGRILLEMNYMLAYGSGEASMRLLWKYGLLELILPFQAAYLVRSGFRRKDTTSNMLLSLISNMDKFLAPDRPCHTSLWIVILAFHKALSDQPRYPLAVAAFGLAVHNGGNMSEAINIARSITMPHDESFRELLENQNPDFSELKLEVQNIASSVKNALTDMTDEYHVSKAMAKYPRAPYTDLVFVSFGLYLKTCSIFECARKGRERGFVAKQGSKIDYDALTFGSLQELRHVFARIIFDTVYPLSLSNE
ncbi:poly(A) polymerase I-like isoform X2 [Impatiens glandulifera]|nr:poly(A) polymerase I-like isoform X2 [Impatiens glandulifera]